MTATAPIGSTNDVASARNRLDLLAHWVRRQASADGAGWFDATLDGLLENGGEQSLVRAIGLAPRKLGKADLVLSGDDRERAQSIRSGFDPSGLSVDQAARIAFMLAAYRGDDDAFASRVAAFARTADLSESIAYLRGLAVFPAPRALLPVAAEGVRSSVKPIFEAVAHRNPYPAEFFDEGAWNQMVLKALFIDSTLAPIQRLDERANPDLAEMLVDYAHERWAAGRPVSAELWRCVGPHADERALADLERVLSTGTPEERAAAKAALAACPLPRARELLASMRNAQ